MEWFNEFEKIFNFSILYKVLLIFGFTFLIYLLRKRYKLYLSKRLFFSPWVNMTNDKDLDIGLSLSEMLFFELEAIQDIHKKSATFRGLWNEKNQIPVFEQSADGGPNFLGKVELLGATGTLGFLLKIAQFIIFFPDPMILRGSIHKYGNLIRLQATLEGLKGPPKQLNRSQCWKKEGDNKDNSDIPEMISDLAHSIYMTLADNSSCKSTESFRKLTMGLKYHLEYDSLTEEDVAKNAIENYEKSIRADGGKNALASYNLATIHYSKYTNSDNEKAAKFYQEALHTTNHILRAQAYCGLANCYCQKVQRHKSGDDTTLIDAIRFAEYSYQIQKNKGIATIAKGLAYTWQVLMEKKLNNISNDEGENNGSNNEAKDKAIKFYLEAIDLNKNYTIAYNNLGNLYFNLAENEVNEKKQMELLCEAEKYCKSAIDCDPTYHHAYDNLGNICMLKHEYKEAEKNYYSALDYAPSYYAAFDDLSKLFLHLAKNSDKASGLKNSFYLKAFNYHFQALKIIDGEKEKMISTCNSFGSKLKIDDFENLNSPDVEKFINNNCVCKLS